MEPNNNNWMEYFRLITPFMLIVLSFVGWSINNRIEKVDEKVCLIDNKLFTHLTNDEIHVPRGLVVSQEAFALYQTMRDKEMQTMKETLIDVKNILLLMNRIEIPKK